MAAAASFDADAVTRHGGAGRGLGVHAASRKIGKPAGAAGHGHQQQERKPVIIYMVSPKVIHVEAHEFLPLVQRLTGPEAAAAGRGDKKSRPSTSGGGEEEEEEEPEGGARSKTTTKAAAPPVRVKARALNRPAGVPAVSVSVTAMRHQPQQAAAAAATAPSPSPSGLLFRDLSPLRGAALKGEHLPLVSPAGWLHHVAGDHFLSPGGAAATLGSPPSASSFLDIFGPLSSSQQQ